MIGLIYRLGNISINIPYCLPIRVEKIKLISKIFKSHYIVSMNLTLSILRLSKLCQIQTAMMTTKYPISKVLSIHMHLYVHTHIHLYVHTHIHVKLNEEEPIIL